MKKQQGFTLIELMIVIAILGILVAIALPAYQDYTVRAKTSEAIAQSAPAKLAVSEAAASLGKLATSVSQTESGFAFTDNSTKYVKSISIAQGVITVVPNEANTGAKEAMSIKWTPKQEGDEATAPVTWACSTTPATAYKYVPAECRKPAAT